MRVVRLKTDGTSRDCVIVDGMVHGIEGDIFRKFRISEPICPLADAPLLAPVQPTKIVGTTVYGQEKRGSEPRLFIKTANTVIGPHETIELPQDAKDVRIECELAVVIGRKAKRVSASDALDYVFGYTCANDVTALDVLSRDEGRPRGKCFDTFTPLGPWIETDLDDPNDLAIRAWVNGEERQNGSTRHLALSVAETVAWFSNQLTLMPGDVVIAGTPHPPPAIIPGDRVEIEVEGIGMLANNVAAEGR